MGKEETKKIEKTEDNILSFLAANALINRCEYQDLFSELVEQEEIANIVARSSDISYRTLYDYHNKMNGQSKLILLKSFIDNEEYLKEIFKTPTYTFKLTNGECSFIISYLLSKDNYKLLSMMFNEQNITLKKAKNFKIDKEVKEKWEGFLIMDQLTN
jgi:hypothetical protein